MANKGWIKLHRSVMDNWVYQSKDMFYYWIDLLLLVNHEKKKIPVYKKLEVIEAGQKLTSYRKLAERWNVDTKTVRKILDTFKDDGMITLETKFGGTVVTICNYSVYQGFNGTKGNTDSHTDSHGDSHIDSHADSLQTRMNKNDIKNEKEKGTASPDSFSLPVTVKRIIED